MCPDIGVSAQRHVEYFERRRFRFLSLELFARDRSGLHSHNAPGASQIYLEGV